MTQRYTPPNPPSLEDYEEMGRKLHILNSQITSLYSEVRDTFGSKYAVPILNLSGILSITRSGLDHEITERFPQAPSNLIYGIDIRTLNPQGETPNDS